MSGGVTYEGSLKILSGEIRTWQELLIAAINARVYSADSAINAAQRALAIGHFRGAQVYVRRLLPMGHVFTIDAFKSNKQGVLDQSGWTLPEDVTAIPGGGNQMDGGVEYRRNWKLSIASVAVYAWDGAASADTTIYVEFEVE